MSILMTYIRLVQDYRRRNRALHMLIAEVELELSQLVRRVLACDELPVNGWSEFKRSESAHQELLIWLGEVWNLTGMNKRTTARSLKAKQYIKATGRIEEMLNNVYVKMLSQDPQAATGVLRTIEHIQGRIAFLEWENGLQQPASEAAEIAEDEPVGLSIFEPSGA